MLRQCPIRKRAAIRGQRGAAAAVERNPILVKSFTAAKALNLARLKEKMRSEGDTVIPDVVAYAVVLENVSHEMGEHWESISVFLEHWKKERAAAHIERHMGPFDFAKLLSVEKPIQDFIRFHRDGAVDPNFLRGMLPLNIMEATVFDASLLNFDNVEAGRVLAWNPPSSVSDARTGTGPASWSPDGRSVQIGLPLAQAWDDLYQSWNLAFVSHYSHFPYVVTKLLVPSVSEYQADPRAYIYHRALALYAHLNFGYLGRADDARSAEGAIQWSDDALTDLWGKVNRAAAREY